MITSYTEHRHLKYAYHLPVKDVAPMFADTFLTTRVTSVGCTRHRYRRVPAWRGYLSSRAEPARSITFVREKSGHFRRSRGDRDRRRV